MRGRGSWALVMVAAIAAGCASSSAPAPQPAAAEAASALDTARRLVAEARPHAEKSSDEASTPAARSEQRDEAIRLLREARTNYDRWLDAHPADEPRLDHEYIEMMVMLHGLRRDARDAAAQ